MITKEEWRSGDYRNFPEFKTQEGYYSAVKEFVNTYGEPTKEDMLLVRNGEYKEFLTGKFGASWNPNINSARKCAKLYYAPYIYVTFIPKGTMAVHYELGEGDGRCGLEEEYVIDVSQLNNVNMIAKHTGEWDCSSDFETDFDFERWELLDVEWMGKVNRTVLENLFESGKC